MSSYFVDRYGQISWISIAVLVFALAFFVVGLYRVVEFKHLGFGKPQVILLTIVHCIGCAVFSFAFAMLAVDADHGKTGIALGVGCFLLLPLHIYVALKRRMRLREEENRRA